MKERKPLRQKSNTSLKFKAKNSVAFDPILAAEDRELRRLEKLLGIKKKGIVLIQLILYRLFTFCISSTNLGKVSNDVKEKLNREFEEEVLLLLHFPIRF